MINLDLLSAILMTVMFFFVFLIYLAARHARKKKYIAFTNVYQSIYEVKIQEEEKESTISSSRSNSTYQRLDEMNRAHEIAERNIKNAVHEMLNRHQTKDTRHKTKDKRHNLLLREGRRPEFTRLRREESIIADCTDSINFKKML